MNFDEIATCVLEMRVDEWSKIVAMRTFEVVYISPEGKVRNVIGKLKVLVTSPSDQNLFHPE